MEETGQVIAQEGDMVKVSIKRQKACDKCRACTPSENGTHMQVLAANLCGAVVGDWVQIELESSSFLRAVLIMCGLPLVALIAGFGLGLWLAQVFSLPAPEPISFFVGIILATLTYTAISHFSRKIKHTKYTPTATRITEPITQLS